MKKTVIKQMNQAHKRSIKTLMAPANHSKKKNVKVISKKQIY